jgi:hypothetical protein
MPSFYSGVNRQALSSGIANDLNGIAFSGGSTGIALGQAGTTGRPKTRSRGFGQPCAHAGSPKR